MIYPLNPARTALLVIDVQNEYFKEGGPAFIPAARSVLPHILELRDAARQTGALVAYIQHVKRADGSDIGRTCDFRPPTSPRILVEGTPEAELLADLQPQPGEVVIRKRRFSSFLHTDLACVLATRDIDTVIIAGYMTSFCCETTARDAHDRDFRVLFVRDAVEGPDLRAPDGRPVPHQQVLENTVTALRAGFAEIVTVADVASRLAPARRGN
jgi:biuret amidohydrolase